MAYDRVARETLKQAQKRMKRDYDVKVRVRELKLGDLVYQLDTATVKGKTRKLSPSWKGPGTPQYMAYDKHNKAYLYTPVDL
jgi:hypothetical protein